MPCRSNPIVVLNISTSIGTNGYITLILNLRNCLAIGPRKIGWKSLIFLYWNEQQTILLETFIWPLAELAVWTQIAKMNFASVPTGRPYSAHAIVNNNQIICHFIRICLQQTWGRQILLAFIEFASCWNVSNIQQQIAQRAVRRCAKRTHRSRSGTAPMQGPRGLRSIGQTWQGSFSAVSKPNFARKYALESSCRDLHNALRSTALQS